jgi:hypothetical protein
VRFDTPIYFQRISTEYDATTGNYREIPVEEKRFAAVTSSSTQTLNLVYGEIRQGSLTLRLQTHYTKPFVRIRIGKKFYRVDANRKLRQKHTFVVSEVQ